MIEDKSSDPLNGCVYIHEMTSSIVQCGIDSDSTLVGYIWMQACKHVQLINADTCKFLRSLKVICNRLNYALRFCNVKEDERVIFCAKYHISIPALCETSEIETKSSFWVAHPRPRVEVWSCLFKKGLHTADLSQFLCVCWRMYMECLFGLCYKTKVSFVFLPKCD